MINKEKVKKEKRLLRKARTRAKISGTKKIPRLSVYRSLSHIYAQLIDDVTGKTLVSANDKKLKGKKIKMAQEVGKDLAIKALDKKIKVCVFDKGGYKYHGRIKAVAEGARAGGLKF